MSYEKIPHSACCPTPGYTNNIRAGGDMLAYLMQGRTPGRFERGLAGCFGAAHRAPSPSTRGLWNDVRGVQRSERDLAFTLLSQVAAGASLTTADGTRVPLPPELQKAFVQMIVSAMEARAGGQPGALTNAALETYADFLKVRDGETETIEGDIPDPDPKDVVQKAYEIKSLLAESNFEQANIEINALTATERRLVAQTARDEGFDFADSIGRGAKDGAWFGARDYKAYLRVALDPDQPDPKAEAEAYAENPAKYVEALRHKIDKAGEGNWGTNEEAFASVLYTAPPEALVDLNEIYTSPDRPLGLLNVIDEEEGDALKFMDSNLLTTRVGVVLDRANALQA